MKIALICDTHFGVSKNNTQVANSMCEFFDKVFFSELQKRNIKNVIHLGDLFHSRREVNTRIIQKFMKSFFKPLYENDIEVDLIIGNHDCFYKSTNSVNTPQIMKNTNSEYLKNWNIYSEYDEKNFDNLRVSFISWINPENYESTMEKIKSTSNTVAFGHLQIQGYKMYANSIALDGQLPQDFKFFDKVFTGHFHHKNISKNIYYLGTSTQHTWHDVNETKGFHVFDTETGELEFIENPFNIYHDLTFEEALDSKKNFDGQHVRINVSKDVEKESIDGLIKSLEEKNKFLSLRTIIEAPDLTVDDEEIEELENTHSIIRSYVNGMGLKESKKLSIVSYMDELYETAMEN